MSLRRTGILTLAALSLVAAILSGCSLLGDGRGETTTVTDYTALFHFDIPGDWQSVVKPGLIAVSASEDPIGAEQKLDTLWMLVYTGSEPSSTPVPEMLTSLVEQRSKAREWSGAKIGKPDKTRVGGHEAHVLSASGIDKDGVAFRGRFYFVRTERNEIVIQCVAPKARLGEFTGDIDRILGERWFWSPAAKSSDEATGSAEKG